MYGLNLFYSPSMYCLLYCYWNFEGKTQLAMQLCVDTRLPKQFGGNGAESIYIDSEGSFSPERCYDMAKALVDHVHNSAQRSKRTRSSNNNPTRKVVPKDFTPDSILDSIHVFRVYDETCQSATILSLPTFLKKRKENGHMVKLLVIDSIAFHYRVCHFDYLSCFFILQFLIQFSVLTHVQSVCKYCHFLGISHHETVLKLGLQITYKIIDIHSSIFI